MSHLFNHGYINECDYVLEQLEALEDGELAPRIQDRVLTHLPLCAGCRAARDHKRRALGSARVAIAQHPRIAAPVGFDARVWETIEQRAAQRPVTLRARLGAWALRPIPRLLGSACFGLGVALAFGHMVASGPTESALAATALPAGMAGVDDADASLSVLYAMEQRRLRPFGKPLERFVQPQVLAPAPEAVQEPRSTPQRRSQENSLWPNPPRPLRAASSSDAGSWC